MLPRAGLLHEMVPVNVAIPVLDRIMPDGLKVPVTVSGGALSRCSCADAAESDANWRNR